MRGDKRGAKNIIRYCIQDLKVVTLVWLNDALDDFDYGYSEKSQKPSPIKDQLKDVKRCLK